jgi:hypothetical protein
MEAYDPTEQELEERDERIKEKLISASKDLIEQANEMERLAKEARIEACEVQEAVFDERWWSLDKILTQDEIESLCEISPARLVEGDEWQ